MASGATGAVVRHLERLFTSGVVSGLSEGQLLDRFVNRRDEAAFEALVSRHGPMVLTVCRRLLRDPNDVDDAFQATFLVLVRKAGSLRRRDLLGNWLYGVAYRVAVRSRSVAARRAVNDVGGLDDLATTAGPDTPVPELYEEIDRLPERYRSAVVLCYLEGLTHEEAAERLGWPVGTVKGRLARSRDLLRSRLTRRGLTLATASAVADRLATGSRAAVPAALLDVTVRAAARVAYGPLASAGLISVRAVTLAQGVLNAMTLSTLKTAVVSTILAGTVLSGAVFAYQFKGDDPPASKNPEKPRTPAEPPAAGPAPTGADKPKAPETTPPSPAGASPVPPRRPGAGAGMASSMMGLMGGGGGEGFGGGMGGGMGGMGGGMGGRMSVAESRNRMRVMITALANEVARNDSSPRTREILKKLDEPIGMKFATPTPLDEVLKFIKSATAGPKDIGIPIYVDPEALNAHIKKIVAGPDVPNAAGAMPFDPFEVSDDDRKRYTSVSLDLSGVPLRTSLRLLLKQLDLAYCVRDGVLIISSVEGVYLELMEAAKAQEAEAPQNDGAQE